jgi:hypothetical protein
MYDFYEEFQREIFILISVSNLDKWWMRRERLKNQKIKYRVIYNRRKKLLSRVRDVILIKKCYTGSLQSMATVKYLEKGFLKILEI